MAALIVSVATEPDPPAVVEFGGDELLSRMEVVDAVDAAFGVQMKRSHVPRAMLRVGSAALSRVKPDVASLMGMAWYSDTHPITWTSQPLTSRGIVPRTTSEYIGILAGQR